MAEDRARPLIAVVAYHLAGDRVARWPEGGYGVPKPYLDALRRAGARTTIVAPGEEGTPEEILEPFDGLAMVGGGDVDPSRYGGGSNEHLYGIEPDRDDLEIALLLAADRLAMPTLCICRGMQVMNVAFGGTLHPHLPDRPNLLEHGVPVAGTQTMHDVMPEPGSRLSAVTKSSVLSCSSHHHQGVDRLGDGLDVTGRSPDGLVEAIERIVADPQNMRAAWMLGVQWHPEETAERDPAQQALFEALVQHAERRVETRAAVTR
jgi:putative glutamine amidotransferase